MTSPIHNTCNSNNHHDEIKAKLTLTVMMLMIVGHLIYMFSTTVCNKTIIVCKKYQMTRNGYTELMITDSAGVHYNLHNSIWHWKWNAVEDWNEIKEGDHVNVSYYGFRIAVLGMFPVVYKTKIKTKGSIVHHNND